MEWIVQNSDQLGTVALLSVAVFAFFKGWIRTGSSCDQQCGEYKRERDEARTELKQHNTTLAELVTLLKQRERGS